MPFLAVAALAIGHLAVFWFELYKILVFTSLGIFLILAGAEMVRPSNQRRNWAVFSTFMLIYAYIVLATRWAPIPEDALENAGRTLASALPAYFAGELLARRYNLDRILAASCVMPLIFFPQIIYNIYVYGDPALVGNFSIRTILGVIFAVVVPMSVGMYFSTRKIYYIFTAILFFMAVIIIQSRTGILIAPLTSVILIYSYDKKAARNLLSLGLLPLLFLFSLMNSDLLGRFANVDTDFSVDSNIFAEFSIDRSLRVDFDRRLHTYMAGKMFTESPIFGDGYSSMLQNNKFDFDIDLTAHGYPGYLAELGLMGALLFLFFLYYSLRDFVRLSRTRNSGTLAIADKTYLLGFAAILLAGFFHQQFESAFFGWSAGILSGLAAIPKRKHTALNADGQMVF